MVVGETVRVDRLMGKAARRPLLSRSLKSVFFACSTVLAVGQLHAQVIPTRPIAPTREEVERPVPERPDASRPQLTVEGEVDRAPCALDRPEYQNIRFTLNDVTFDGLRGLPPEALRPAFASAVGQEVPVTAICEIRDRAAAILREAGYVAAIEVPEQRIADGNVRFNVVMAKLVGLRVRGDAGRAERTIAGYLSRLTERDVFNRYDAERYLLLAGDLPGYNVRLALRSAGGARGEVIGEVIVQHMPVLVDFTVQNYGSQDLGPWGGLVRGQFFGLTGLGDRTSVSFFTTSDFEEQQSIQLAHDMRLGSEGLTLGGQITFAWANPDFGNDLIDLRSRTMFATLEAGYPFIRRQSETLRGGIGLDIVNQDIDFNDLDLFRDRLRVAFARLGYEAIGVPEQDVRFTPAEPRWRFGGTVELRQGLDIFGATDPCLPDLVTCLGVGAVPPSRLEGDPTSTVVRGGVYGEFRPAPRFTVSANVRGQYSSNPLLSFEEFSAGNYTIGRGYDPGALTGDSGFGFQLELRYGSAIPRGRDSFTAEPFVFWDQAWNWNEDVLFPTPDEELTSIGIGVRAAWGDRLRAELTFAIPRDRPNFEPDRDPRLLLTITTRLWPWSFR